MSFIKDFLKRLFYFNLKKRFPFDINYSPVFEIIYIFSMHSGNITAASICASDGVFLGMCAHLSAQFRIISHKIETIVEKEFGNFSHENITKFTKQQNEHIYEKLVEIVKTHNEAIKKCEILSKNLWHNILIYFFTASITICTCCIVIMKMRTFDILIFIVYIIGYTIQMFNYAYAGNLLVVASTDITVTAYNLPWYKCDTKVRKAILMIMIRAQKEVNIKIPFIVLSLETLGFVRI